MNLRPVPTIVATLLATMLLLTGSTPASATGEPCSDPVEYGSYALRARIEEMPGGRARGYAYVSLDAGHSVCEIRGRMASTGGNVTPPATVGCLGTAVTHLRVGLSGLFCDSVTGRVYSAFSIRRSSDGNIAPKAQSPVVSADCT